VDLGRYSFAKSHVTVNVGNDLLLVGRDQYQVVSTLIQSPSIPGIGVEVDWLRISWLLRSCAVTEGNCSTENEPWIPVSSDAILTEPPHLSQWAENYFSIHGRKDYECPVSPSPCTGSEFVIIGEVSRVSRVPEPSTLGLLGIGLAGLAIFRRWRER
jgi:hypothetical protein